jgi:Fe-S-cluster formation regulator IscX/YfhJ
VNECSNQTIDLDPQLTKQNKMKTAIIIISDPKTNHDDSNGRLLNALSLA